ncbi:MAG: hypothetical protein AMXMBFR64_09510 [Myxococcales bacterium]
MAPELGREALGRVVEALPSGVYKVDLDDGRSVYAHVASTMRLHFVQILPGDRVALEVSPYDTSRARIIRRIAR